MSDKKLVEIKVRTSRDIRERLMLIADRRVRQKSVGRSGVATVVRWMIEEFFGLREQYLFDAELFRSLDIDAREQLLQKCQQVLGGCERDEVYTRLCDLQREQKALSIANTDAENRQSELESEVVLLEKESRRLRIQNLIQADCLAGYRSRSLLERLLNKQPQYRDMSYYEEQVGPIRIQGDIDAE